MKQHAHTPAILDALSSITGIGPALSASAPGSLQPRPAPWEGVSLRGPLGAIAAEVAAIYGLPATALQAATRRHDISHPRQHAMATMRAQLREDGRPRYSLKRIANYFGLETHTTVAYAVRAHRRRVAGQGGGT